MKEYLKIFLPKSNKEVSVEISLPRYFDKNTKFDTIYFLDGQNAFKDSRASFGRSIRATRYIGLMSGNVKQKIIGVAIHNAGSDMGRINEYTPFKITYAADQNWKKQDIEICNNFCDDFVNVIIPYIDKKYNVTGKRFIYGSSLAAITAIYLGYKYDVFDGIGAFSTAGFLCPKELDSFIENNIKKDVKLFLYVGKNESSDDLYDQKLYYNTSLNLLKLVSNYTNNVRLIVSDSGTHSEATWERQLLDFLSFMYYNNLIFKI